MAWVASKTFVTGDVLTSTDMNEQVRDRLNETAPAKATTAGDVFVGTGANAIKRLGIGTALQVLRVNSGASDVEWAEPVTTQRAAVASTQTLLTYHGAHAATQPSTGAWHSASEAMYIPLIVTESYTITTLEWRTGSVGSTGNYDIGIYSSDAEKLPSTRQASLGSTAFPAANTTTVSNIADVAVTPGLYYIAFVADNATDTVMAYAFNAGNQSTSWGANPAIFFEASAGTLPATATPAVLATGTTARRIPYITAWTA